MESGLDMCRPQDPLFQAIFAVQRPPLGAQSHSRAPTFHAKSVLGKIVLTKSSKLAGKSDQKHYFSKIFAPESAKIEFLSSIFDNF